MTIENFNPPTNSNCLGWPWPHHISDSNLLSNSLRLAKHHTIRTHILPSTEAMNRMPLVLGAPYIAPTHTSAPSSHKRSASIESTSSTLSTLSSSCNSSYNGTSLRQRRGVTFQLSFSELPAKVQALELLGHLVPGFDMPQRRRALPKPIIVFDPTSVMGEVGAKISSARDFGMGEGWTVVKL